MLKLRNALAIAIAVHATALFSPSYAQCSVPNVLTNGQVADASEVMDNFNAVADCADAAVTTTGAPTTGAIAVFSGAQAVTSGNLTGDVTTSGSTVTSLTTTGVTAGNYTNPSVTVDAKGRITSINSGQLGSPGTSYTKFVVANPGDAFIDVKLDLDDGYAYDVIVRGAPTADTGLNLRVSSDNGATFYAGTSDYKYGSSGAANAISLTNGSAIQSGRTTMATFVLTGLNVAANDRIALTGTVFTVITTPANLNTTIGGHNNALASNNFNAFRILVGAGNMNNFAVYVQKIY